MMTIVITMAGLGSRFKKAGYQVPKYQIEAHGKTLFDWSMDSLTGFFDTTEQIIFIVRKEDQASEFIKSRIEHLPVKNWKILEIEKQTAGQAETAMLASEVWRKASGLLIYNIDTYVEPMEMRSSQITGDGFIPCFTAPGEHWSFVKLGRDGRAMEVKEKVRISDHCTLGAYYFKTCALYERLYQEYYSVEEHLEQGEKYVAPLYQYLISKGGDVRISNVDFSKVHVLGTPEELAEFQKLSDVFS